MRVEDVEELLRTGRRFPPIPAIEVLVHAAVGWDEERGTLFRTQIGRWNYSVAEINPDRLDVLCIDAGGATEIVSVMRRAAEQQATARRRYGN